MAEDLCEAEFISTTTTTKKAVKMGSWGGGRVCNIDESTRKKEIKRGGYSDYWGVEKEGSDKSGVSVEQVSSTTSTSRRLSDHNQLSDSREDDNQSVKSMRSDHSTSRSMSNRSRFAVDFFNDDFDATMNRMIGSFSNSLWHDADDESFFQRRRGERRLIDEDDFFSRQRLTGATRQRAPPSIFNSRLDDFWGDKRLNANEDYAESGVYSNGSSSRLSERVEDVGSSGRVHDDPQTLPVEKFEVDINVQGYKANELLVRTDGRRLIITATKKNEDGSPVEGTKELKREFALPVGVDPYKVASNLLPSGFLKVEAPLSTKPSTDSLNQQENEEKLQEDEKS